MSDHRILAEAIWQAGTAHVGGRRLVAAALEPHAASSQLTSQADAAQQPNLIFAVGKAAASMCEGAMDVLGRETPALVVTKYNHTPAELRACPNTAVIESGHPIPDENSLKAGAAAIRFVKNAPKDSRLIVLGSGGASALCEDLSTDMTLPEFQTFNERLIADGFNIDQINARRREISNIKGGNLLANFKGNSILVFCISDVEGDGVNVIGSGIANAAKAPNVAPENRHASIIGNNAAAREAAAACAKSLGLPVVTNKETLYKNIFDIADDLAAEIKAGPDGVYIWGGEPTVELPKNPGEGGRNQSLALAIARAIKDIDDLAVIAAGTDGTDGPTDAAGGIVDGHTWFPPNDAALALQLANAGPFLAQKNSLLKTGPTGTNTMDMVIAVKGPPVMVRSAVMTLQRD